MEAGPVVVEYRQAGPYDVAARVQRSDGWVFPKDRDLVVTTPFPVARPRGLTIRGGRNVLLKDCVVVVDADYRSAGSRQLAVSNRALYVDHRTTGTVTVTGLRVSGSWLYEGVNVLGTVGTSWVFRDVWVTSPVKWWPTMTAGVGSDHDGGDLFQTLGSWASVTIDGWFATGGQYQGFFCKREKGYTAGPIDLRNIHLRDFRGPGAAFYVNPSEGTPVTAVNVTVDPAPTSYGVAAGVTAYRATVKTVSSLLYGGMSAVAGTVEPTVRGTRAAR